jgi:predicted nucleotidyltransferase
LEFKELGEVVNCLRQRFKLYGVILFGSRARGDFKPWSDYDLLIVGEFNKSYLDRLGEVLEVLSCTNLPIEPHPYTLDEAIKMLLKGNPLIVDALSEGIVLYETKEFEVLKERFNDLVRKGLRKSEVSVVLPEGVGGN